MKKLQISVITCVLTLLALSLNTAALTFDANIYQHYNYSSAGKVVATPAAYTPVKQIRSENLSSENAFTVTDVCAGKDFLYVLDGDNGRIYVLNKEYNVVQCFKDFAVSFGSTTLSKPEGLFLRENELYIADTENQRILVCNAVDGTVIHEYTDPHIRVLGDVVDFFPSRIGVNSSGRMFIVAKNVNRGLVLLNEDGSWGGFMGAPKVKVDWSTYFYRLFATEEQLKRMQSFVPTEYNSVDMDEEGFVYATIGSVGTDEIKRVISSKDDSGEVTPIKRLNASGDDILARNGFFAPVGDIVFNITDGCSVIVDVAVHDSGMYSMLDGRRGHIFTYDQDGNLLYILGGTGDQIGCFSSASSLTWWDETLVVADKSGFLTFFEVTDYGMCVNHAVRADYGGDYKTSDQYWNKALDYDSNLYTAYIGKGKAEYRQGNYLKAMTYYRAVGESKYYSKAKEKFRQEWLEQNVVVVGIIMLLLIGVLFYFWFFRRNKSQSETPSD